MDGEQGVSDLYNKYFINGNTTYLGRATRYKRQGGRDVVNSSFQQFALSINLPEQAYKTHRNVVKTLDAGFKSVSKYDKFQPTFLRDSDDEESWALSFDWCVRHFAPYCNGSVVLSEDDAVAQLDKQTSCGYPWNLVYRNKSDFLASSARLVLSDYWDEIQDPVDDCTPRPIWTCSQKDEMRSNEKLLAQKHRTFLVSPIEHTVALGRLCLDFNERFYQSNNKTWSFVGASKYFGGWDRLIRRLDVHPNGFALDESDYDSSLFARAMNEQSEIRYEMLHPMYKTAENKSRMSNLYDSIVHSVIILENGELVQKHTGNPSGSGNTIVDNTMILYRLTAYSYILSMRKAGLVPTFLHFHSNTEAALNGDDNDLTVSDELVTHFNATTIKSQWSAKGITTKTDSEIPRKAVNLDFLSQTTVLIDGHYLPVPDRGRVLSSLFLGSPIDNVLWHYMRACALRLESWPDLYLRDIIQRYILYLQHHFGDDLRGEVRVPGFGGEIKLNAREILAGWRTDEWIAMLYSGQESTGVRCNHDLSSIKEQSFVTQSLHSNASC